MTEPPPLPNTTPPAPRHALGYYAPQHAAGNEPHIPNPAATASLICGWALLGLFLSFYLLAAIDTAGLAPRLTAVLGSVLVALFPTLSIAALVLGIIGIRRARRPGVAGALRARTGSSLGIAGLIVTAIGIVGVLAMNSIYGPAGNHTRSQCRQNLMQIAQGIQLYASDNAGQLPASIAQLVTATDLGTLVLICPSSTDVRSTGTTQQDIAADLSKPGQCSYVYLGAGLTINTVKPKTILAHDNPQNHASKGVLFLYGDYRVEWVEKKEAARILAELQAGFNPPRPKP